MGRSFTAARRPPTQETGIELEPPRGRPTAGVASPTTIPLANFWAVSRTPRLADGPTRSTARPQPMKKKRQVSLATEMAKSE